MKIQCLFSPYKKIKSKFLNYILFDWYYVHLIKYQKYLNLVKQFEFLKKVILNEGQIKSLSFGKKINMIYLINI